jgi:hypothetical protein
MKKLILLLASVVLYVGNNAQAATLSEKLRVLSIDLGNAPINTPGLPGGDAAQELRGLLEKADPDVLCLQGATDWESCERIANLKPGFRLLTCSAFEAKTPGSVPPQVAIIARDRAPISWVEQLPDDSGFAFAVIQAGARRLGIFSAQTPKTPAAATAMTDRLLAEVSKLKRFPQNRPDSFLFGGAPLANTSLLTAAAFQTIPPEPVTTQARGEFWVANAGFIARPRTVEVKGIRGAAVICDFDVGNSFPSKFAYQTPLLFAGETPASLQAAATVVPPPQPRSLLWPIVAAVFFLAVLVMFFGRRTAPQSQMQLVPLNGPNGALANGTGIANEAAQLSLLAWVKTAFVQRLLSQRQQMMATEVDATRRTLAIEEKLTSLQSTLQGRISAYESRIERLEVELTAATVENRDLIRSQIDLLREKVAKAKEEHGFRRN